MTDLLEPYKSIRRLMDAAPEMNAKVGCQERTIEIHINGIYQRTSVGPGAPITNLQEIMPYLNEICEVSLQLSNIECLCFIRYFLMEARIPIVQAEKWSKCTKQFSHYVMGPNSSAPRNIEEIETEFRNIQTNADAVAFKLRWL